MRIENCGAADLCVVLQKAIRQISIAQASVRLDDESFIKIRTRNSTK